MSHHLPLPSLSGPGVEPQHPQQSAPGGYDGTLQKSHVHVQSEEFALLKRTNEKALRLGLYMVVVVLSLFLGQCVYMLIHLPMNTNSVIKSHNVATPSVVSVAPTPLTQITFPAQGYFIISQEMNHTDNHHFRLN